MKTPGTLKFALKGKEHSLQPVTEDDGTLFIIFRDGSNKKETYTAGRFLYATPVVNGEVVLDFNKAENPPCAFTPFATCPLPPPQNTLDVQIKAGEKRNTKVGVMYSVDADKHINISGADELNMESGLATHQATEQAGDRRDEQECKQREHY